MTNHKDTHETLGTRICTAREALGFSTAQFARRLGIKSGTLTNWQQDRAEPRSNRLVMLAGTLGVSPTWLLTGFGSGPQSEQLSSELALTLAALRQAKELHQQSAEKLGDVEARLERLIAASKSEAEQSVTSPALEDYAAP